MSEADYGYIGVYTESQGILAPLQEDRPLYAGRLRSDVPMERADQVLTERARALSATPLPPDFEVRTRRLQDAYTQAVRPRLLVIQGAAALVLLIGCLNVVVLSLVRNAGRRSELAVRRALGAGRLGLVAPLAVEGAALSLGAGLLGLGGAALALPALGGVVEARLGRGIPGGVATLHLAPEVVAGVLLGCLVAAMAMAATGAWAVGRVPLTGSLAANARQGTDAGGARRLRHVLVGGELALSLTLLTGAALLARSALHLEFRELGFDPEGLQVGQVGLRQGSYPDGDSRSAFFRALLDRVEAIPGVEGAAVASSAPFVGDPTPRPVEGEGGGVEAATEATRQAVSPGYFDVMGVPVVRGRDFRPDDGPAGAPVAVVTPSLADALWPGVDPLGRRLRFAEGGGGAMMMGGGPSDWLTVVGVVPDVVTSLEGAGPMVYTAHEQAPSLWMSVVLRTRPGGGEVMDRVADAVHELDPEAPVYAAIDVGDAADRVLEAPRFFAVLLGGFSLFALGLATLGLYGVVAYATRQARRDVAIRMALGAQGGAVQRFFVRQSLVTLALSLGLGAAGGRVLGGALEGQLHGVEPGDPGVILGVSVVLGLASVLAVWLPAREAARTDPMGVLRE